MGRLRGRLGSLLSARDSRAWSSRLRGWDRRGHKTRVCKAPTKSLPEGRVWLEPAALVRGVTATSLCSDGASHPRTCKHCVNRPPIFAASLAGYPQFTAKETEGLPTATFPEHWFYWSRFPTLRFKYSTVHPSQQHVAARHFGTSFRITESQNHRMVGVGRDLCGSSSSTPLPPALQRAIPAAARKRFASTRPLLQEEAATVQHIAPIPALCQVCPKPGLRVTLAAKEKLFENNCPDLLSCKFNCNQASHAHAMFYLVEIFQIEICYIKLVRQKNA